MYTAFATCARGQLYTLTCICWSLCTFCRQYSGVAHDICRENGPRRMGHVLNVKTTVELSDGLSEVYFDSFSLYMVKITSTTHQHCKRGISIEANKKSPGIRMRRGYMPRPTKQKVPILPLTPTPASKIHSVHVPAQSQTPP